MVGEVGLGFLIVKHRTKHVLTGIFLKIKIVKGFILYAGLSYIRVHMVNASTLHVPKNSQTYKSCYLYKKYVYTYHMLDVSIYH
jgi:hypothetical protein